MNRQYRVTKAEDRYNGTYRLFNLNGFPTAKTLEVIGIRGNRTPETGWVLIKGTQQPELLGFPWFLNAVEEGLLRAE
jgi:hypothetical protein